MKKRMFFVFAAMMTAVFFSSCNSLPDPEPVTPMVEKLYTVKLPCVTSHQEPILGQINLCAGGVSPFSRVNGWKTVIDTSYTQFVFTATGYNATDLVVNTGPGGIIEEERTIVSNPSGLSDGADLSSSSDRDGNPIWSWIWPILIGLILLVIALWLLFGLYNMLRDNSQQRRIRNDENRREEDEHQQYLRNQEWARMREAMGLNRQTDGDFLNRMNAGGMKFSISNEEKNPPVPPADGGGPGSDE